MKSKRAKYACMAAIVLGVYVLVYLILTRVVSPAQDLAREKNSITVYRFFPYDYHHVYDQDGNPIGGGTGMWDTADRVSRFIFIPLCELDERAFDYVYSRTGFFPGEYNCMEGRPMPGRPVKKHGRYTWEESR